MIVKRFTNNASRLEKREGFMNLKTNLTNILLLVGMTLLLANCSNSSDSTTATGSCASGQVYTQMGCLSTNTSICGTSAAYGYWSGGTYNGTYYNAGCYAATTTSTATSTLTCNASDYVQTAMGSLQAGSCATYCSQYGKRYGYYNGMCYPSVY